MDKKATVAGVGILDIKMVDCDGNVLKTYTIWKSMIQRCFSDKIKKLHPTYIDVTVCDEWKYFSKFDEWYTKNVILDWHLDKDLLSPKDKIYSPNTCCFLPREINGMIQSHQNGKHSGGVAYYTKNKKYVARTSGCKLPNKKRFIGMFDTEEDARKAYCSEKESRLKSLALVHINLFPTNVYQALSDWKCE